MFRFVEMLGIAFHGLTVEPVNVSHGPSNGPYFYQSWSFLSLLLLQVSLLFSHLQPALKSWLGIQRITMRSSL
jgi:hypothetical protein